MLRQLTLAAIAVFLITDADCQELVLPGDDPEDILPASFLELLNEAVSNDLDLADVSHLSYIRFWEGVMPASPRGQDWKGRVTPESECRWRQSGEDASPVSQDPIACLIDVPETGEYRFYLHYALDSSLCGAPVKLTITPQTAGGGESNPSYVPAGPVVLDHTYGQISLLKGALGAEQEKMFPIRFDRETDRISTPSKGAYLWEYRDGQIQKGIYRVELSSSAREARVRAFFMTRSKDFRPSLSTFGEENTLSRLYLRFRLVGGDGELQTHDVRGSILYHWFDKGRWGDGLPGISRVVAGEWSPFVDATDPVIPIPRWATWNIAFGGVTNGTAEIQFAWRPADDSVLHTVRTANGTRGARIRVPCESGEYQPNLERPIWGVWLPVNFSGIKSQEQCIEPYFRWAKEADEKLGLPADHPTMKGIRIFTGNGVLPPYDRQAYEMLCMLGVNWMMGAPPDLVERYGLFNEICAFNVENPGRLSVPADQRDLVSRIKMGDEINTAVAPEWINTNDAPRAAFHEYLAKEAEARGHAARVFYGIEDMDSLECPGSIEPGADLFSRRVFYHSQRFRHLAQIPDYKRLIEAFEALFPNARIYNNYSPHPVFLTGCSMNNADWFVLPRNGAQTLAWAEDWSCAGGSWSVGTRDQCVTYYAALVECGARKRGYPSGFYVGVNCGNGARKMFSCIGQGVTWLHLYDWGPLDAWAEASNAWSEYGGEYYAVMMATHALGPADAIVSEGEREPRRAAILYNRSYEIWTGGAERLNHDWMWSFIALKSDQIPVEIIIEEDLDAEGLSPYDVLYMGGFNLERHRMKAIREWVESGGLLIGSGGCAIRDEYNEPMQETADLFGADQAPCDPEKALSSREARFNDQGLYPPMNIQPSGPLFKLEPTTGTPIAHYQDGSVAAVERPVGKGRVILLGMQPGFVFTANGKHDGPGRGWHNAPALKRLGRQRLEYSHHASEAVLFEHDSGLAVLLTDFGYGQQPEESTVLSVEPRREIGEVVSGLRRPLAWTRKGDRIEITMPAPDPVDVVILK